MIKRHIKFFTFLLVLALIAGMSTFNACKKEEIYKPIVSNNAEKDYIDELINKTGIDIYALASSPELLKYFEAVAPISKKIAESIDVRPSKLTEEEKIARMHELVGLISQAALNYDFDLIDTYFKELNSLLYGPLNPWESTEVAFYENELFRVLNDEAQIFNEFLDSEYPVFFTLNRVQQEDVIEAIVNIIVKKPQDCAGNYARAIQKAEAIFAIGIAGCCFTGPGAWACAAAQLAIYCVSHHYANKDYAACLKG